MGSSISSVIENIENKPLNEKLAYDALNSLIELAFMQKEAFWLMISNPSFDTKLIPIDQAIMRDIAIQANVSTEPAAIGNMISGMLSAFASGDIAQGISRLVSSDLNTLMGQYSENQAARDDYAISTGELGGVFRIDMHFFAYRYQSEQLTSIVRHVVLVSLVISSVDLRALNNNLLRVIVQERYGGTSSKEDIEKMYEQLKAARDSDNKLSAEEVAYHFKNAVTTFNGVVPAKSENYAVINLAFAYETAMGEAEASIQEVKGFILGAIGSHYLKHNPKSSANEAAESNNKDVKDRIYDASVFAEVPEVSTSSSIVVGEVSLKLHIVKWNKDVGQRMLANFKGIFDEVMNNATNIELSYSEIRSYSITDASIHHEVANR